MPPRLALLPPLTGLAGSPADPHRRSAPHTARPTAVTPARSPEAAPGQAAAMVHRAGDLPRPRRRRGWLLAVALAHLGIGLALLQATAVRRLPKPPTVVMVQLQGLSTPVVAPAPGTPPATPSVSPARPIGPAKPAVRQVQPLPQAPSAATSPARPNASDERTLPPVVTADAASTSSPPVPAPAAPMVAAALPPATAAPMPASTVAADATADRPLPPAPSMPPHPPATPVPSNPPSAAGPQLPSSAVQYLQPPAVVYPRQARRDGQAGRVLVRAWIAQGGGVPQQVLVQQSSGHARLDEAALQAVRNARFKPFIDNGQPVAGWVLIPIDFDLAS